MNYNGASLQVIVLVGKIDCSEMLNWVLLIYKYSSSEIRFDPITLCMFFCYLRYFCMNKLQQFMLPGSKHELFNLSLFIKYKFGIILF